MTERTISAEERAWEYEHKMMERAVEAEEHLARLSAWVSGDVARARELAEELKRRAEHPLEVRALAAEIVSLLTPKEEGE